MRVEFNNSSDNPLFIQVDPWASLFKLNKGENIVLIGEGESMCVDEQPDGTRIVTLCDSEDFYILKDGQKIHWRNATNE